MIVAVVIEGNTVRADVGVVIAVGGRTTARAFVTS